MSQASRPRRPAPMLAALVLLVATAPALGDNIIMKNGLVYRGAVQQDNTLVFVFDGLKQVVVRDSKIARRVPDASFGNKEVFRLEQPLVQHAGVMPKEAFDIKTSPWNDRARRTFEYVSARSGRPVSMEQAIYEMGPFMVKIRGVDGFWQDGRLSTSQVPREVVLGILAKVQRDNQNERRRVASFLIQSEWYPEARRELDALLRDFPDDASLRDTVKNVQAYVSQLEATQLKAELEVRRKAQQFRNVAKRLKSFPSKDVPGEILVEVREQMRRDDAQAAADRALATGLHDLAERIAPATKKAWRAQLGEVLLALDEAPDAVRDRLVAWQKAKDDPASSDDARFALAMSGYVVGADAAVSDVAQAASLWRARDTLREYLATPDAPVRAKALNELESFPLPAQQGQSASTKRLDTLTRLALRMTPPLDQEDDEDATGDEPRILRVRDDQNAEPTEYAVRLPPEYHALRSYPAVVALHDGGGPREAIAWWQAEASRRGYIVIAPEYRLPGQGPDYTYTTSEHAAVELALRDARRRFSIDGDRVYLGGQLRGGDMAWDFGLAHPDLFAGVAVISGRPFKYPFKYQPNAAKLPFYVAIGDLAPAGPEIIFQEYLKPLISRAYDATYVEYYRRGLEDLPEEAPSVFDWMDRHQRDPYPKEAEVVTARDSDNRFYGVVVQEFHDGRITAPEAADPLGKNLKPATIKLSAKNVNTNLLIVQLSGVRRLDVWVSPKVFDFKKRIVVRINNREFFKTVANPNIEPFLEDLRLRGDRQQIYWLKVSAG